MSTRTPRPPIAFTPPAKVLWKVRVASSKSPKRYARQLERGLNALTSKGYAILAMTDHNGATVLHGQKTENAPMAFAPPLAAMLAQPQLPKNVRHEVIYTFLRDGKMEQLTFETLPAAVRALREGLKRKEVSPLSLTTVVLSTFEPSTFEALLSLHKETP